MTPADREVVALVADVLDLCIRRACADDNAADALAVVRDTVAAWAERADGRGRVHETLYAVLKALKATGTDAPAGAFERRFARAGEISDAGRA